MHSTAQLGAAGRHNRRLAALLALLLGLAVTGADGSWKTPREALDHVRIAGHFRIFYALEGVNALAPARRSDLDGNGVPDYVDDIALQLQAAEKLFVTVLGFQSPLASKRYAGRIRAYDVHLLAIDGHGSSGDGIVTYRYRHLDVPRIPALTLTLSCALPPGNLSPAHEFFHAIQNGYTVFKNRWFTEGTARWSETALGADPARTTTLPAGKASLQQWLSLTYGASRVWNRLAGICDDGANTFSLAGLPKYYVSDGAAIFADDILHGQGFMKHLLANLAAADHLASKRWRRGSYDWSEAQQKAAANDPYLLCAIQATVQHHCAGRAASAELQAFVTAVRSASNNACLQQLDAQP